MPLSSLHTVFIDLDGTIADNFHIHTKGWDSILKIMGKKLDSEYYQNLHGANTEIAIRKISEACNFELSEESLKKFIGLKNRIRDIEINKLSHSNLFPGVSQFLKMLKTNKVLIVCCSISSACRAISEKLEVVSFFDDYICGNKMNVLKSTSPNCYLEYSNHNNLSQQNCLVIDDDIDVLLNVKKYTKMKFVGFGNKPEYINNKIPTILNYKHTDMNILYNLIS